MPSQTLRLAAFSALATLATATCQMSNGFNGTQPATPLYPAASQLCVGQGAGDWTFALWIYAVDVPSLPAYGGSMYGSYEGGNTFIIYDNECNVQGFYGQPSCGVPYTIEENFLTDVLTLQTVDTGLGGGSFSFTYGDGKYTIGNDQCTCGDMSSGLEGAEGCKCGFPVSGVSS